MRSRAARPRAFHCDTSALRSSAVMRVAPRLALQLVVAAQALAAHGRRAPRSRARCRGCSRGNGTSGASRAMSSKTASSWSASPSRRSVRRPGVSMMQAPLRRGVQRARGGGVAAAAVAGAVGAGVLPAPGAPGKRIRQRALAGAAGAQQHQRLPRLQPRRQRARRASPVPSALTASAAAPCGSSACTSRRRAGHVVAQVGLGQHHHRGHAGQRTSAR